MKLIIDISEEDYKKCTDHLRGFNEKALKEPFMNATLRDRLEIALLHGTPFDSVIEDIKAEIRKLHPVKRGDSDYANGVYDGECWVIDKAFFIIDKHISKAESEDKE